VDAGQNLVDAMTRLQAPSTASTPQKAQTKKSTSGAAFLAGLAAV